MRRNRNREGEKERNCDLTERGEERRDIGCVSGEADATKTSEEEKVTHEILFRVWQIYVICRLPSHFSFIQGPLL